MNSTYGTMYYVTDMSQAVAFYKSKLGLNPTHESANWTEFSIGGHNLCLHLKEPGTSHNANGVLIINADGVKNLFQKMKNDGINVFNLHEIHPSAWSFHIKDKDGNEVSVYGAP